MTFALRTRRAHDAARRPVT